MGFKGSESNIRRIVRTLRRRSQDVYVPLSFAAGEIDWSEAYAYIDGVRTKLNVLPDSVIRQTLLPHPDCRFDTSDTTECYVSQYATVRYSSNE